MSPQKPLHHLPRRTVQTAFLLLVPLLLLLAAATFLEKANGTAWVHKHIYGTAWFTAAWALPCLTGAVGLVWQYRRLSVPVLLLHLALLFIAAGACITRLTGIQGVVHLREGVESTIYYIKPDARTARLPFSLCLKRFDITYRPGSDRPADYRSDITVAHPDGKRSSLQISMNRIGRIGGWRLYQSSFDEDGRGSLLSLNHDPWGTGVTYTGYALLWGAFLAVLLRRRGLFRTRLKRLSRLTALGLAGWAFLPSVAAQGTIENGVIPREQAQRFETLQVMNEGRVQPFGTLALYITRKLTGKSRYRHFTNEQIALGCLLFPEVWQYEPLIEIKSRELRNYLKLPENSALHEFFTPEGTYKLNDLLDGQCPELLRAAQETHEKVELLFLLQQGSLLNVFPAGPPQAVVWYAPADSMPDTLAPEQRSLIRQWLPLIRSELLNGNTDSVRLYIDKLKNYQTRYGGNSILPASRMQAELIYNRLGLTVPLSRAALVLGVVGLMILFFGPNRHRYPARILRWLPAPFLLLLLPEMVLRSIICGRLPLGNGYETLLTLAFLVLSVALLSARRLPFASPFGVLSAGAFLLVSTFSRMDPQIMPLAPVLHSPLLGIHVSAILAAYALLSMTFLNSLTALFVGRLRHSPVSTSFSYILLVPALALLATGIFLGAVWANISWGNYWSWDPKETWALITLLVYAVPVHQRTFAFLRRPLWLHSYLCAAFAILLMTYLGVNYLLGGLHSYA